MADILFRASGCGALMTDPRLKKDKDNGVLSNTAKTFVKEIWMRDKYGFDMPVVTPQMLKGLLCEQDVLGLMNRQIKSKDFRLKNRDELNDDKYKGTPDVILKTEGIVEDAKCSWTLMTFFNAVLTKMNYAQAQVYMRLTGLKKFRVVYAAVNTPEELLLDEKRRFYYKFGCDEENVHYIECSEKLERIHKVDYVPESDRWKMFEFEYNEEYMEEMDRRVIKAREYYNTLKLKNINVSEIEKLIEKRSKFNSLLSKGG